MKFCTKTSEHELLMAFNFELQLVDGMERYDHHRCLYRKILFQQIFHIISYLHNSIL